MILHDAIKQLRISFFHFPLKKNKTLFLFKKQKKTFFSKKTEKAGRLFFLKKTGFSQP